MERFAIGSRERRDQRVSGRFLRLLSLIGLLVVLAAACTSADDSEGEEDAAIPEETPPVAAGTEGGAEGEAAAEGQTLQAVQDRGTLICGVNDAVPGFGFTDEEGNFSGFDIDFCRVIAAAVLGDSEAVEFLPLTAEQRFTALQSGGLVLSVLGLLLGIALLVGATIFVNSGGLDQLEQRIQDVRGEIPTELPEP
jgi:ABC-type amino acid transport substrate-binding protein